MSRTPPTDGRPYQPTAALSRWLARLARLDPGETSANVTRSNGQTLVLLMMCGRTTKLEDEGPSDDELTNFIRNQRLDSFANGYLEQLRAEARIIAK